MANIYFTINVIWAVVFFLAAIAVAVYVGRELSNRGRICLGAIAVMVGVGVGFSMMAQYFFDRMNSHFSGPPEPRPIVVSPGDPPQVTIAGSTGMQELVIPIPPEQLKRIDDICRSEMTLNEHVKAVVGDQRPLLDFRGYTTISGIKGSAKHPYRTRVATVVYVFPQPIYETEAENGEDVLVDQAASRIYFDIAMTNLGSGTVLRVYRKVLLDGELIEVPIWDRVTLLR